MHSQLEQYIIEHISPEPELLQQLYRQTQVQVLNPRMTSGHLQGRLLKILTQISGSRRVLELGTFTGYSALCFAEALPDGGVVHTIEENDELEDFAQSFFAQSPHKQKIIQHIGKALDIIPTLDMTFDLVFLDADKREYSAYYNAVFDKIPSGGIILADNTLWNGKVILPITPDDRQTQALVEFNRLVANDSRVETVIMPLRDGLTLIRKK